MAVSDKAVKASVNLTIECHVAALRSYNLVPQSENFMVVLRKASDQRQ